TQYTGTYSALIKDKNLKKRINSTDFATVKVSTNYYLTMKKEILSEETAKVQAVNEINSFMKITPQYSNDAYEGSGKLNNKKAIITASDNGIGKAVSIAFAKEGADIAMVYNHENYARDIKSTVGMIEKLGRIVWIFKSCTFDEFKCKRRFESISKKVKEIDILVNTFAISHKKVSET